MATIDSLFVQLENRGNGAYGLSDVTQLEHALQAAALASEQGLPDPMVVAALFHDVGHLVSEEDINLASEGIDDKHEIASADALEPLFGADVSEPVRLHVPAKRYLCTTEPDYFDKLSEDSKLSLELQGGLMTESELLDFAANPHHQNGVILRRLDDQAKQPGLKVPSIDSYRGIANACAVAK